VASNGDYNAPTILTLWLALTLAFQVGETLPFPATPSPAHARLFAPPQSAERYQFLLTDASIEDVARICRERWPSPSKGSWAVAPGSAGEAFDVAALFDRPRLARLYGGTRPKTARGPIGSPNTRAVVLLLSPYPEADLKRLNAGTLIMVVALTNRRPPSP
jgi:hypothetical protein